MNRNKPSLFYTHILHVSDEMQDPPPNVLHSHNDVDMGLPVPLESLNQAEGRTLVSGIVLMSVNILRHSSGWVPISPVDTLRMGRQRKVTLVTGNSTGWAQGL